MQHGAVAFSGQLGGEEQDDEIAKEGDDEGQRHGTRSVGDKAHEQKAAAADRGHHQQR